MAILPQRGGDEGPTWWPWGRAHCDAATPSPASGIELLVLDSPKATVLYWGSVALVVSGLFATRLLPCVDYPQHLALSDIARRLQAHQAPEAATYELNFFTYNGLFHFVVAWLSKAIPIELAGRFVLAASLVAMAAACLALVRVLRRPPEYAALFVPVLFSFSFGWGFANYVLATAIVAWALLFVALAALRPSFASIVAIMALGLLCAFAHVLAMLVLCAAATALGVELAWRQTAGGCWTRLGHTLLRAAVVLLPLAIGCAYCVAVYRRQYSWDPNMYRDPTIEGTAPPLWQKVAMFGAFALDLFDDATDQVILWIVIGVMLSAVLWSRRDARAGVASPEQSAPIVAPFAAMTIAYFCTPMVCVGTHLIFPRLGQWLMFGAVLATPRFPARMVLRARRYILGLSLVAGANVFLHCALFGWETKDASEVIDELPPARAATAVIWEPWTHAFRNGTLTHLAAYYAARKHGQWAFAFARYLSVPVRFKPNSQPAWPARGWEFDAEAYDPRCKYARAFPLVIVRAPEVVPRDVSGEPIVRKLVFKGDANTVRLLAHHGRFWAFDTTGVPEDGSL